jgi:hypothetical protein
VGGGLDVAGHQPEQVAVVDEPLEELLGPLHHAVPRRGVHLLGEVREPPGHELRDLLRARLPPERGAKALAPHLRVGYPAPGNRTNVDIDVVQLLEGPMPRAVGGAAGANQGAVDVEQHGGAHPRASR